MNLKTTVSAMLLALTAVACTSTGSGPDRGSRPLTLEALGIQPEFNNGEKGLWMQKAADGKTFWAAERLLCLQTFRPVSKSKVTLPNGETATYYDKKCTVTCTCTSGDSGC